MIGLHPTTVKNNRGGLRVPKAADVLADQIRRQIIAGELAEGERLPPEAELMAQWQLGRPAVREALRILESEALVKVQRGNVGGAIVQAPSVSVTARSAAAILQSQQIPLSDIYQARLAFETGAAYLAAKVADDASIAMLHGLLDDETGCVDDARLWSRAASRFHQGVVAASGVRTLKLFSDMTAEIIDDHQVQINIDPSREDVGKRRAASRSHAKLVRLIEARDAKRAQEHWQTHLEELNIRYFGDSVPFATDPA
ncbi:MAG TPA: GntR family transcriptional regulator [Amycolatopsis sp.]|nr:GntR family transcriptional regulator [Amycolatopsis sp.]